MIKDYKQEDNGDEAGFTICVICIILAIAMTLIYNQELWEFIDWVLTYGC